jgi:hypothetical protein
MHGVLYIYIYIYIYILYQALVVTMVVLCVPSFVVWNCKNEWEPDMDDTDGYTDIKRFSRE